MNFDQDIKNSFCFLQCLKPFMELFFYCACTFMLTFKCFIFLFFIILSLIFFSNLFVFKDILLFENKELDMDFFISVSLLFSFLKVRIILLLSNACATLQMIAKSLITAGKTRQQTSLHQLFYLRVQIKLFPQVPSLSKMAPPPIGRTNLLRLVLKITLKLKVPVSLNPSVHM